MNSARRGRRLRKMAMATVAFFIQSVTLNSGTDYFDVAFIDRPKDFCSTIVVVVVSGLSNFLLWILIQLGRSAEAFH